MSDREAWAREALEVFFHDLDEGRLALYLGCLVDPQLHPGASPQLALASARVRAVHLQGDSLRYRAEVELTPDPTRSPGAIGLPAGPVVVSLEGEVSHEHKLRFTYFIPNVVTENRTSVPRFTARAGEPVMLDEAVFDVPVPVAPDAPTLESGRSLAVGLERRLDVAPASGGGGTGEIRYSEARIPARAGEPVRLSLVSKEVAPVRFIVSLARPECMPVVWGAQMVGARSSGTLDFRAPADVELRVRVWSDSPASGSGGAVLTLAADARPVPRP